MKRPAAASPEVAPATKASKPTHAKQAPAVDPFVEKCDIVSAALRAGGGKATEMLITMLPFATQRPPRHKFQEGTLGLVKQELECQLETMRGSLATLQATVSGADAERERRSAAITVAVADVDVKTAEHTAAKAAASSALSETKTAKQALAAARAEQKEGDAELATAEENHRVLSTSTEEKIALENMEGPANDLKPRAEQLYRNLTKVIKDVGLLNAALKTLSKSAADRAVFDKMVLTQLTEEMAKGLEAAHKSMEEGAPGKDARQAKVQGCETTLTASLDAQLAAEVAESDANVAKQVAHDVLKAAQTSLGKLSTEVDSAALEIHSAELRLAEFQSSALQAFADLVDPEAAEARAAAAAAEAAARAAAAAAEAAAARDAELDALVAASNAEAAAAEAAAAEAAAAKAAAASAAAEAAAAPAAAAAAEAAASEAATAETAAAESATAETAAAEVTAAEMASNTDPVAVAANAEAVARPVEEIAPALETSA